VQWGDVKTHKSNTHNIKHVRVSVAPHIYLVIRRTQTQNKKYNEYETNTIVRKTLRKNHTQKALQEHQPEIKYQQITLTTLSMKLGLERGV